MCLRTNNNTLCEHRRGLYENSSPTALPFFIFLSAFFTFSLLTQCTSSLTTHVLYIFPALSLCLANLYNSFSPFFCFQSSIQIVISTSLCLILLFFVELFSIFISYFVPCILCLFPFFYTLLNFLIPPPCLPVSFFFPNVTPGTVSAVLFSISAVLSQSIGNPFLPPKVLVTSYLNIS